MTPPGPSSEDAREHLWNAAHEFLKAMRALVDAADEFVEDQRDRPKPDGDPSRVQRIDIDDAGAS
jgi:hypothetical protein